MEFHSHPIECLRVWFTQQALPAWSIYGVDRQAGGFFEKLDYSFSPTKEYRRSRLVSRQIYMFSVGLLLGWEGPSAELMSHGLRFLRANLLTLDGQVRASCTAEGLIIDARQHLYDIAFVILALSKLAHFHPENEELEPLARRIVKNLVYNSSHPIGGYYDSGFPDQQCTNPHMHLFEAFLAWNDLNRFESEFWRNLSGQLANLALNYLIIPESGAIPEYFDSNWSPLPKSNYLRIEPGHQFEWSWLLARWASLSGSSAALIASDRLCSFAEKFGVSPRHNVAFECINEHGEPKDFTARLWQQTERAKAWHLQALLTGRAEASFKRDISVHSLLNFLSRPEPGLWYDEMTSDGSFVEQPVKASSGYHIACALEYLIMPVI